MKTKDQILKIRATVLYVLQAFPMGLDYIKLFKILYFAQRSHLAKYGRTIIDDTFQARQFGPVSGFIRKGLKLRELSRELSPDLSLFCQDIEVGPESDHQMINSSANPDMDELSVSEIRCLNEYIDLFRNMDSKEVSSFSHQDSAWIEAYERSKKDPQKRDMTILEIAEVGGASSQTLDYIRENLELDQILN